MSKNGWMRFIITLLIIIGVQYAVNYALFLIGVTGIVAVIIMSLVMAFLFALLNYPQPFRRYCYKDPKFHSTFAIFFIIFFLFNLIF